ncbi:MAG TPA: serine protease, partial [Blastocatellia bacterium]
MKTKTRESDGPFRIAVIAAAILVVVLVITGTSASASANRATEAGGTQLPHLPFGKGKNKSGANSKVRLAMQSVGAILVRDNAAGAAKTEPWARGSGVVVSKDGIIATNMHVLLHDQSDRPFDEIFFMLPDKGAQSLESGRRYNVKVLTVWPQYDLALLKVSTTQGPGAEKFPAVELADSRKTQVLDPLTVIGYPETGGTTATVSTGVVQGTDPADGWIKTDARLIHGNSGGA